MNLRHTLSMSRGCFHGLFQIVLEFLHLHQTKSNPLTTASSGLHILHLRGLQNTPPSLVCFDITGGIKTHPLLRLNFKF